MTHVPILNLLGPADRELAVVRQARFRSLGDLLNILGDEAGVVMLLVPGIIFSKRVGAVFAVDFRLDGLCLDHLVLLRLPLLAAASLMLSQINRLEPLLLLQKEVVPFLVDLLHLVKRF